MREKISYLIELIPEFYFLRSFLHLQAYPEIWKLCHIMIADPVSGLAGAGL